MIGIFDSGVGGLTVVKKIVEKFNSDIIYLGDTARLPYGTKSPSTVIKYSLQNASFLMEKGVEAIVIACNTASSVAIDILKKHFNVPVFGVIEPAAKKASSYSKVGVIGTESTISSRAYPKAILRYNPSASVAQKACPLFVPLVEAGWIDDEITKLVAKRYLDDMECEALILGCTHYPLLKGIIKQIKPKTELIDSAEALSESLKDFRELFEGSGNVKFFTTDSKERFSELGKLFLGKMFNGVTLVDI